MAVPVFPRAVFGFAAGVFCTVAISVTPVNAESLSQALASAYNSNPTILAERARLQSVNEQVPQALSGWRPTIVAGADAGVQHTRSRISGSTTTSNTEPAGVSIELNQPIFRGFRTVEDTKRAEAAVLASRENLRAVEQQVLFDAATAFMNVIRDREIVNLRTRNVTFLREQLKAAQARFDVGEITRTDVAQSRARLSLSLSNLSVAQANLRTSEANYMRLVGHNPRKLTGAKILYKLPRNLKRAISTAERANPNIIASLHLEDAAQHTVKAIKGNLLPEVSVRARYQFRHDPSSNIHTQEAASLVGQVRIPIYQAGRVYSQVRQAKQDFSRQRLRTLDTRRQVRESVVSAWHILVSARRTIQSFNDQVNANRFALEGVRQEALVGSRTTLDVLDAEQELVDSRVSLAQARRDAIVAAYRVLASIGKLTARDLRLRVNYYDPDEHYSVTRDKLFGTDTTTVD